jgi:hypothetical protein
MIPAALIDAAINHLASRSSGKPWRFPARRRRRRNPPDPARCRLCPRPLCQSARRLRSGRSGRTADRQGVDRGAADPDLARRGAHSPLAVDPAGRLGDEWQVALQAIRRLSFEPARGIVVVTYLWQGGLLEQARSLAFRPADIARLGLPRKRWPACSTPHPARAKVPLSQVLPPLLICCGDPSAAQNRAALLVLAGLRDRQQPRRDAAGSPTLAAPATPAADPARAARPRPALWRFGGARRLGRRTGGKCARPVQGNRGCARRQRLLVRRSGGRPRRHPLG